MQITEKSHPYVYKAFQAVELDNGAQYFKWMDGPPPSYDVPKKWAELVPVAERALAMLSTEEFELVTVGEQTEKEALIATGNITGLPDADKLLAEFFNGWIEDDGLRAV